MDPALSYEQVCQLVGQLYLESRQQIEVLSRELTQARAERGEALKLLQKQPGAA